MTTPSRPREYKICDGSSRRRLAIKNKQCRSYIFNLIFADLFAVQLMSLNQWRATVPEPRCVTLSNGTQEWRLGGKLHREDGPAKILADGSQSWYRNGKLHRDDGPAVVWFDGTQEWRLNGQFHREDGPAKILPNGTQIWCRNGLRHREDGPAIVWADGDQEWYRDGQLHREDGPAVIKPDGTEEYWEHDRQIIKNDHTFPAARIQNL